MRVDHYVIERATGSTGTFATIASNVTLTRYADTAVAPSTTYSYRVSAVDPSDNTSDPSDTARATTASPPPAGIVFRAASQAANKAATTITVARPSGVLSGDVLLASIDVAGTPTLTAPNGWQSVRSDAAGSSLTKATYWHLVGPNEPASYVWTFSAATSASGVIVAYSGVDSTAPIEIVDGQANASGTAVTAPSVSVTTNHSMLVGFFGIAVNTAFTPPRRWRAW